MCLIVSSSCSGHEGRFKWSEYLCQPGPVPALAHIFTEVVTTGHTVVVCMCGGGTDRVIHLYDLSFMNAHITLFITLSF